jgi:rhamnogalacturonan endolyase
MTKSLAFAFAFPLALLLQILPARAAEGGPVTVTDTGPEFVLANGIVTAHIDKRSADVVSIVFKGQELLQSGGAAGGRTNGYWSLPGTTMNFGANAAASVRTDPSGNGGDRAVVAVQFTYDKGANTIPANVEMCYALARGDSALYLWALWEHKPGYPPISNPPVGRFAAKLNADIFDYLAVDPVRQRVMPTAADWGKGIAQNMKEARLMTTGQYAGQVEHKYDYAAVQFENPAYGWASTAKHIGLWLVTPSNEYMSGGATKVELNAHLDGNQDGYPTLLNVWKGPHYGGSVWTVAQSEEWTKCVGPFLMYCNSSEAAANEGREMWADAIARAGAETKAWPYDWVNAPAFYTPRELRATVSGQLTLNDPLVKQADISHLLVGLSAPDWNAGGRGGVVDWQHDGKNYQFWVHGADNGRFSIPNVRAGVYTLHAFATGVLGEFARTDIKVEAGKPLDLGTMDWKPVRDGTQVWEIGVPDRTAGKFFQGPDYWHWGIYYQYARQFPQDVHYVIGKSDYHKDWNIMQVPHSTDPSGKGAGRPTTWSVEFQMPDAPHGKATLRIAIAGSEARGLTIAMNDKLAGSVSYLPNTMVIHRDSDRGYWEERAVAFDATLMKAGPNMLKLTVPAGPVTAGIEYDYLRLELDQNAKPPAAGADQNARPAVVAPEGGDGN